MSQRTSLIVTFATFSYKKIRFKAKYVNEDNYSERLKHVRKTLLGLTQPVFAEAVGVKRSTIATIETGRSKPTFDQLLLLFKVFSINPLYVLDGIEPPIFSPGNKLSDSYELSQAREPDSRYGQRIGSYLIPIEAQAGYAHEWSQEYSSLEQVNIPGIQDANARVFEISGDSMDPVLVHGDYVASRKVEHRNDVRDGLMYVLVSRTQGVTVKYLRVQATTIRCYPENTTSFQPFDIDFDEVREIWEVVVRVTRNIQSGKLENRALGDQSRISRLEAVVEHILELKDYQKDR